MMVVGGKLVVKERGEEGTGCSRGKGSSIAKQLFPEPLSVKG